MGQVCQTTDQEGFSEYFYYDEEGRLETRIDRNGNKTTTHYNMDGNLSYQRAEDKKGRNPAVSRYMYYSDGKLRQAQGGGITYDYAYTPNGLLKSKSASGKPLLEYAYDRSRNLSCLTDSAGNNLHYTYDAMDRLKQVSEGQGDILASYSYNPSGGLCRLQYGNGIQTEYGYNDSGALSSLVTVTKQGQVLLNFNYAYDGNGNCIQKSGAPYQNEYAYDRMNRLLEAVQDGKPEKYTYDLAGNRLRKESGQKTEIYEYNAKNQLTGIQSGEKTIQYRYDPQGNLLEELGRTWKKRYAYDAANRQQDIELTRMSDGRVEYFHQSNRYDAEGLRYGRFTQEDIYRGNGLNLYAYCANNPVIYYDPSGYMWLCDLGKTVPEYLTRQERDLMIGFPGAVVPPTVVTPDNPFGIYTIRATGSYADDKAMLAQLLGIEYYDFSKWRAHHIEYNFDTNEMRMQFVDPLYHKHHHFGGAGQFEKITGFKYGSDEAIKYCKKINTAYELQLLKYPKIK